VCVLDAVAIGHERTEEELILTMADELVSRPGAGFEWLLFILK
jgi:hypothetical protein